MDRFRGPFLVMLTLAAAWLAWYGPALVGMAPVALLCWLYARTRWTAFAIGFAYYGVTYACLPGTMDGFFHGARPVQSYALVAVLAALFALVWAMLWGRDRAWWRSIVLLVVLTVPPLGLAHLWNPLFGVSAWFPGTGLLGLVVFTGMLATLRYWPRMVAAAAVAAAGLAHAAYVSQAAPPGWVAVDTATVSEGYAASASTTADDMQQFQLIEQMIQKAQDSEASVMVWPESHLGGVLRPALDFFSSEWAQLTREGKTVVAGFSTKIDGRNINAVGGYGASPFLWEQRFPAMGAMWRPWDAGHNFPMRLGAPYLQKIDGRWTTIAVCFEAGILWPLVASQLHGPQAYIAVGNLSWGRSTNLNRQGRLAVAAWARLTNLPHLVAINN